MGCDGVCVGDGFGLAHGDGFGLELEPSPSILMGSLIAPQTNHSHGPYPF